MFRSLIINTQELFAPHRKKLIIAILLALGGFILGYAFYLVRPIEVVAMLEQQDLLPQYRALLAELHKLPLLEQCFVVLKDALLSLFLLLLMGFFLSFLPILILFSQAVTMGVLFAYFSQGIDSPTILIGSFLCLIAELFGYAFAATWGQVLGGRVLQLLVRIFTRQSTVIARKLFREDLNTAGFILLFCTVWVTLSQIIPLLFQGIGGL